jgi:acyl carrier protein
MQNKQLLMNGQMEGATEQLRAFIQGHLHVDSLEDDKNFFSSGLVNSLFAMQLVLFVEKTFSIKVEIEDLDIANFSTLRAIAAFVEKKLASANAH